MEFNQARLKLKDALRFSMRQNGGGLDYLVEDEVTGRFFRIGLAQYTFLTMLDGQRTVSTALMKTATLLREHAIDESEAASLCKWAIESGLVEAKAGLSETRRIEQHQMVQTQKLVSYLNPMMFRLPLFNPDPWVTRLTQYLGMLVSPWGFVAWVCVCIYGFFQLAENWSEFYLNRVHSFGANDLLWIGITWFVLRLVHESAHSLVCKRFGGRVDSCGVLLLLLIPLPYVDVTSAWRMKNKWNRILVSAAGMMSELFLAAIACCIWVSADPGPLQYHAGNVIIAATLHTLLFNINPLMRFDGYYILTDLLELPNLATHGRQWLVGFFRHAYFGKKPAALKETGVRGMIVRTYGALAMCWFFLIAIGLSLAASSLIEGFGLIVAVVGCVMWIGLPVFKLTKYLISGTDTDEPNRLWFAGASALTVLLLLAFFYLCPSPSVVSAPIVIDYEPLSIVRAKTTGFAKTIHVRDGQPVSKGDLLVTLQNPELQQELDSLAIDIKISQLRSNTLLSLGQISQVQVERESLAAMIKRKTELQHQIDDLSICAPQSGRVLARELNSLAGTYFTPGSEVLSIGTPGEIHAIALTRQADIECVARNSDTEVELFVWGRHERGSLYGQITHINPRARDDLPHEAFAAANGGPLAVVPREQVEDASENEMDLMLTEPRVTLEVALLAEDRQQLLPGQTGIMLVRSRDDCMGSFLAQRLGAYIQRNNFRTHGL